MEDLIKQLRAKADAAVSTLASLDIPLVSAEVREPFVELKALPGDIDEDGKPDLVVIRVGAEIAIEADNAGGIAAEIASALRRLTR